MRSRPTIPLPRNVAALAEGSVVADLPRVEYEGALELAERALARFTLGPHAPIRVSFYAVGTRVANDNWSLRLVACARVPDRESGSVLETITWREIQYASLDEATVLFTAIEMVQKIYLHEMYESVLVGGLRILDPHKDESTQGEGL